VTTIREPQLGGSQAFVADLARGVIERGHQVHVYAAAGSQVSGVEVIDTGVDHRALAPTLYRVSGTEPVGLAAADAAFARVYAAIRRTGYEVVHNHAFDAPAVSLGTSLGAAVVHTLHLPPDRAVAQALRRPPGPGRPAVACVSASQASAWRSVVAVDAILPSYVPTRSIPFSTSPGDGAVFAGRLSPEKGAAEAIAIASAAGIPIELFGDSYDPDYTRERIEPRRGDPGVAVHAAIPRPALWERMARAAVVLCPSRWAEPFGMVAAEAQACGTPVVAFKRGAFEEVIVDGVTGFLIEPDDLRAAAAAVRAAPRLSRSACREHAERSLDLARTLDAHERLYQRLAGAVSGAPVGA
jgi:glycosyltransferase involved in cell wall biosynthesis